MSNQIQPAGSIGPAAVEKPKEDEALKDPAKADYKAGRDFVDKGEYSQAGIAFHNALKGFEEQGDEQGIANASDRLGDVCVAKEEYTMALDHFKRAYAICQKEKDIFSLVALNKKIAGVHKRLGELDTALSILFDIFDHYSQLRDAKGTVEILEVIAEVYSEQGENLKAADALRTIASIHANFKHTKQAREYEERAMLLEQVWCMFTGIIQGRGKVLRQQPAGGGMVFCLETDFDLTDPEEGESIAVNGVCLTARNIEGNRFLVDVSPETLSRTILGGLQAGSLVNLERALRLSDRLGGHMVSGHVDAQGRVEDRAKAGDFTLFTFSLSKSLIKYVIEKGSVAINGVSLTVNSCTAEFFTVSIIPHTLAVTTLGELRQGDMVNIEVDIIGKYVEKLLADKTVRAGSDSKINSAFLAEHGFLK